MKKIFDWTIGSTFRTFGRIIAYLVIGSIIAFLVSKSGVKWTDLLGIGSVKASTTLTSYNTEYYYYLGGGSSGCGSSGKYTYNTDPDNYIKNGTINTVYTGQATYFYFAFNYGLTSGKFYDITINANSNDIRDEWTTNSIELDSGTSCSNLVNNPSSLLSLIQFTNTATSSSNSSKVKLRVYAMENISYWGIRVTNSDASYLTGLRNFGIKSITIDQVDTTDTNLIINNNNANTQNIINNQTQNTQDIIDNQTQNTQDIVDTLTDDTIDNDDVEDAFDFNISENAFGPFGTFLTLPLTWIQSFLSPSYTCSPLILPLPFVNQNLTLPCMTEFWNNLGALKTLIELFWTAVIGVRIFNGAFKLTVDATSSKANSDELTKIRSWEL